MWQLAWLHPRYMCTGWGCPLGLHWPNKYLQWNRNAVIALLNPAVHKPELSYVQPAPSSGISPKVLMPCETGFCFGILSGFALLFIYSLCCEEVMTQPRFKLSESLPGSSSLKDKAQGASCLLKFLSQREMKIMIKPGKPGQNCYLAGEYVAF